jgi:hypothetical protein
MWNCGKRLVVFAIVGVFLFLVVAATWCAVCLVLMATGYEAFLTWRDRERITALLWFIALVAEALGIVAFWIWIFRRSRTSRVRELRDMLRTFFQP